MRLRLPVCSKSMVLAAAMGVVGGCDAPQSPPQDPVSSQSHALTGASTTLNAFILDSIQIDQLGSGLTPDDANLFVGNDPADGTASVNKPAGGTGSYIDWNDLASNLANHQLMDLDDNTGKDPTSFPQSNECVAYSSVLSKMDLNYVASANNTQFAYFGVQRAGDNGDAAYYWLFTRQQPQLIQGQAPCSNSQQRLTYNISGPDAGTGATGDILLAGHFVPNGSPLLTIYQANRSVSNVTAVAAIDYTQTFWTLAPNAVAAVATNTTITAPGALGSAGVKNMSGSNLGINLFAEAAVPLTVFSGAQGVCGASFWGTVITRSSGSGGTSPDLKDLSGPAVFNFRNVTATGSLTATCGSSVGYSGGSVTPGQNVTCHWVFDDGQTSNTCSGTVNLSPGTHTATLTVTDPTTSCTNSSTTAQVTVGQSLGVTATMTPTCSLAIQYSGSAAGAQNPSYSWVFKNSSGQVVGTSSTASGTFSAPAAGNYTGTLTVTDNRSGGTTCTASGSASASAFTAPSVNVALGATCGLAFNYTSTASGGSGSYNYKWTFAGPGNVTASAPTGSGGSATVSAAGSYTATVEVTDQRPDIVCKATASGNVNAFSPLSATPHLTGTCGLSFGYNAQVGGGSGSVHYSWGFGGPGATSPSSSTSQSGSVNTASPGSYTATLLVTDDRTDASCTASGQASVGTVTPLSVSAAMTPTCGLSLGYAATAAGGSGAGVSYTWTFGGAGSVTPATSASASGSIAVGAGGAYNGTVVVTDLRSDGVSCTATANASGSAFPPLAASATLTGDCNSAFAYASSISGGTPAGVSFAWSFVGPDGALPGSSSASGSVSVGQRPTGGSSYTGTLLVTDRRTDGLSCTATAANTTTVYSPVVVHLAPSAAGASCPGMTSDQVTYSASVSGGSGNYGFQWNGGSACTGTSCLVDPRGAFCYEQSLSLTASDQNALCPAATSETEHYSKVTTVTATNN